MNGEGHEAKRIRQLFKLELNYENHITESFRTAN
jgi:hypothetical protein